MGTGLGRRPVGVPPSLRSQRAASASPEAGLRLPNYVYDAEGGCAAKPAMHATIVADRGHGSWKRVTVIYVFIGLDSFSQRRALEEIKASVGPPESRDANVTVIQGATAIPGELVSACQAMPFLAERRLIVVDGLLHLYNERSRGGTGRRGQRDPGEWDSALEALRFLPPTTDVVFTDGQVSASNPLLVSLKGVATVQQFDPLPPDRLRRWIGEQAQQREVALGPAALALLADLVGPDLWTLDNELEKLSLYAGGRSVTEEDVTSLVPATREVRIFGAVDAVVERNVSQALRRLHTLLSRGDATPMQVLAMLARQARLMLLATDLLRSGVPQRELGGRLTLTGYPLQKTLEQSRRYSWGQLVWLHDKVLEADVAVKTGALDEGTAIEVLVAEVCSPPRLG